MFYLMFKLKTLLIIYYTISIKLFSFFSFSTRSVIARHIKTNIQKVDKRDKHMYLFGC